MERRRPLPISQFWWSTKLLYIVSNPFAKHNKKFLAPPFFQKGGKIHLAERKNSYQIKQNNESGSNGFNVKPTEAKTGRKHCVVEPKNWLKGRKSFILASKIDSVRSKSCFVEFLNHKTERKSFYEGIKCAETTVYHWFSQKQHISRAIKLRWMMDEIASMGNMS